MKASKACPIACLSEFSIFSYFLDKQAIGHAFDAFKTARHARARSQKVNRQVIGHANGNAMRCQGRCPITCLLAKCHVRLLACPISADRQVIGQLRGHDIAITLPWLLPVALPWPLPSHCESIAITYSCHCRRNHGVTEPVPRRPGPKGCKSGAYLAYACRVRHTFSFQRNPPNPPQLGSAAAVGSTQPKR